MAKGRPRRQGRARENNGRASRSLYRPETEREARQVAVEARTRLYGLPERDAGDQRAGTLIGRMNIVKEVTEKQHRAALEWINIRSAYLRAIAAPGLPYEPREGSSVPDEEEYAKSCANRIERYENAVTAVLNSHERHMSWHGDMLDALDAYLLCDEYVPRLHEALIAALDVLFEHFFEAKKDRRAA